jgi:nicotinamidase-related amidase
MGAVSRLVDYRVPVVTPTLVLVDFHLDCPGKPRQDSDILRATLETCRDVLACARRGNIPVAFVRQKPPQASFLATNAYPHWIEGIEPGRSDMVFERGLPSCYASSEFAQMAARSPELVLAGLFGETACLSTLIEAFHRNHAFTFLTDASCSSDRNDLPARELHRCVIALSAQYAKLSSARDWMEKVSASAGAVS